MNSTDVKNEDIDMLADASSMAKKINSLLNSPKSRIEGLQLLNIFLPQCPEEYFTQYCISWMQNCCKSDGSARNKDYIIHLLSDLLKISSKYQELKKSVSFFITTRYFDFFFKHFLHSQAGWSCTQTCMIFYRGACGPFQESLEKQLRNEITRNVKISSTVAYCYALLPSVGGGGSERITYKKNWRTQFVKLLNASHSLLNELFVDVEELEEYDTPENIFEKNGIESSASYLSIQLQNHCNVLKWMLLSQYPSEKSIPIDLIFQLICRGLAVTLKNLEKQTTTGIISLQKVLPEIHCSLLTVLKGVIVTCKNQLLPYSHIVCKLFKQVLENTESEFTSGRENSFGHLRVLTYETLCNWLAATRSGSCVEVISNVVISNAVSDILSKKKVVLLKGTNSEKKSKKKQQVTLGSNLMSNGMSTISSDQQSYAALKALQFLLKFVGILLKPEEHEFLQELVVKLIVQVQRSVSDTMCKFNSSCRLALYSLLLELVLQPCPKRSPPTYIALKLLSQGLNDVSSEISSFCSMALSVTTVIIHPQYNNGGFPPSQALVDSSQKEIQFEWRTASVDVENGNTAVEENVNLNDNEIVQEKSNNNEPCEMRPEEPPETSQTELQEKVMDVDDDSVISSDENSRNTVTFKNTIDLNDENPNNIEENRTASPTKSNPMKNEPRLLIRRISVEISPTPSQEKQVPATPTPSKELANKLAESDHSEFFSSAKSLSPESASEDYHLKKRYFLRSKTKGSSEEPEETMKRTSSIDSLKNTPAKNSPRRSPISHSATKRPRTRASTKVETRSSMVLSTPKTTNGDDEDKDILETFDASFVE